jgi:hypothetical protein
MVDSLFSNNDNDDKISNIIIKYFINNEAWDPNTNCKNVKFLQEIKDDFERLEEEKQKMFWKN